MRFLIAPTQWVEVLFSESVLLNNSKKANYKVLFQQVLPELLHCLFCNKGSKLHILDELEYNIVLVLFHLSGAAALLALRPYCVLSC